MKEPSPIFIREDLYAKVSKRKGFDYDMLRDAIQAGAKPLSRLNLPQSPPPGSMVRAIQEIANTEPSE